MDKRLDGDHLFANAIRFLIDSNESEALSALLPCSLTRLLEFPGRGTPPSRNVLFTLLGPRTIYDIFIEEDHPSRLAIRRAFSVVLPPDYYLEDINIRIDYGEPHPDWRAQLLDTLRGVNINNQGVEISKASPILTWQNLRFRSGTEVRIAQALDRAGVLFFPNCRARLGSKSNRLNCEPDFLVCYEGKWGILEVDSDLHHPPTRAAQEHERDRLFQAHGLFFVQRFDQAECFENADGVVQKFLKLLGKLR